MAAAVAGSQDGDGVADGLRLAGPEGAGAAVLADGLGLATGGIHSRILLRTAGMSR